MTVQGSNRRDVPSVSVAECLAIFRNHQILPVGNNRAAEGEAHTIDAPVRQIIRVTLRTIIDFDVRSLWNDGIVHDLVDDQAIFGGFILTGVFNRHAASRVGVAGDIKGIDPQLIGTGRDR